MSAPVSVRVRLAGLYGMVDLLADATAEDAARLGAALLEGGARVLQLRMKGATGGAMLGAARALRGLADRADAAFVVNDRIDVALLARADGVHLGQDDLSVADARRMAPALFVGVSTHGLEQALAAAAAGADYLGFGPVFGTTTKARPDPTTGVAALAEVCARVPVPVVAIGGVTAENASLLREAGAAACAPIAAVCRAPDVAAAAGAVRAAFYSASP